ncbi:tRNA methyltransferase 1 [Conglomerata obtusa]
MNEEFIEEGDARIKNNGKVFYNPAQKFNRDLTLLVIKEYIKDKKDVNIFEAMSASGLRGIRFIKEIENSCNIYLNDMDEDAIDGIRENLKLNNIEEIKDHYFKYKNKNIYLSKENCHSVMYKNANKFDVIDIDPFGCCTAFVDTAIATIKDGGLLCLTSTDTGVLCNNVKKCYIKYNSIIRKTPACHELALRVLLGYVCKAAGKFNKHIEPILSVSVDFYMRIYLRVKKGNFKKSYEDVSFYLFCSCFNTIEIQMEKKYKIENSNCNYCNDKLNLCGPFYNKAIINKEFISKLLLTVDDLRIKGICMLLHDEIDTFLYYSVPDLCHKYKKSCIPMIALISALTNLGYKFSYSHCKINSFKTNASVQILYDIINKYFDDKFESKNININSLENKLFNFHQNAKELTEKNYYRKYAESKLGPLARPKKN